MLVRHNQAASIVPIRQLSRCRLCPKKDVERAATRQAADSQHLEKERTGFLDSEKELGWL
ncbi:hypothetical protein ABZX74_34655 [Streptomyces olivaceoviridis]|uniref:hypothetical protein n=1 Tax=Streptomyces olivaceoviridis TaxID=1921 RepID=UPI0033A2B124